MATEEPPDNVIPFRQRVAKPVPAPAIPPKIPAAPLNAGVLIPAPNFPCYPITLEEILDALREFLLHITTGGVGRGLPQSVVGLELVFFGMFTAWTRGRHFVDPTTGAVCITLDPEVVAQVETMFQQAGFRINFEIATNGLRVKPSYLNLIPLEQASTEPVESTDPEDPDPDTPLIA